MTTYTPGPWNQIVYAGDQHTSIVNADKTHIAAVNKKNDAALISAAPDLLAALEELLWAASRTLLETDGDYSNAFTAARAAISRATGATP